MHNKQKKLVVIGGPTAIGKTKIAIQLASFLNTEIISADSRQIYRQLKIGVGRPSVQELKTVRHHLIGSMDITQHYHAADFEKDALKILDDIYLTKNIAIVCGGTGLYIQALCDGLDDVPKTDMSIRAELNHRFDAEGILFLQNFIREKDPVLFQTIDLQNHKRLIRAAEVIIQTGKPFSYFRKGQKSKRNFTPVFFCLYADKKTIRTNIEKRVHQMIEDGWIQECLAIEKYKDLKALQTVGYKEIFRYLDGNIGYDEMTELIITRTYQYAKRQLTWFRRDERYQWVTNLEEIKNSLEI